MPANKVFCIHCRSNIVWNESHGWLISTDERPFGVYHTGLCEARPIDQGGPEAGHVDEWWASVAERFKPASIQ